jgi:hypothetical protein
MIIQFQNIKYANSEWHKNLTNVNIGIFLKIEDCEVVGGVILYAGLSFIRINTVFGMKLRSFTAYVIHNMTWLFTLSNNMGVLLQP